jgi:hypothetical protein
MNDISYEEFNNKAYDRRKLLISPQLVEKIPFGSVNPTGRYL